MRTQFDPDYYNEGQVKGVFTEEAIKYEPMIYGGSIDWTIQNAGEVTNMILRTILDNPQFQALVPKQAKLGYHPVVDTRVVMLMPGWYASIPGWHCDGVIRDDKTSQPDLRTLNEDVWHYVCICGTEGMPGTELFEDEVVIDVNEREVWKSVNTEVENIADKNTYMSELGEIVMFNRSTIHRCPAATVRGWRYFFRLSFYHMPAMNEIRKQVQVYVDANKGW